MLLIVPNTLSDFESTLKNCHFSCIWDFLVPLTSLILPQVFDISAAIDNLQCRSRLHSFVKSLNFLLLSVITPSLHMFCFPFVCVSCCFLGRLYWSGWGIETMADFLSISFFFKLPSFFKHCFLIYYGSWTKWKYNTRETVQQQTSLKGKLQRWIIHIAKLTVKYHGSMHYMRW